jgi:hypothetical protein
MALRTTARTAAFMPGASPPLVNTAIVFAPISVPSKVYPGAARSFTFLPLHYTKFIEIIKGLVEILPAHIVILAIYF